MLFASSAAFGEIPWDKEKVCLNPEEIKLYELISQHRLDHGLPQIPISVNLTWVAQVHAIDLAENNPDLGYCNMHSWSDKGPWRACCYTSDHADPYCMWDKPSEFTQYHSRGYEIVFYYWPVTPAISLAQNAIKGWKGSPGHNDTILNQGIFSQATWRAMGIGIYDGYVVVWFGEELDNEGPPPFCRPLREENP
jgi:hypothetical protein